MNMDITSYFYLIFIALFFILLFAVIMVVRIRKAMRIQHEEVLERQNKYLGEFWENLSRGLDTYEAQFNSSLGKIAKNVDKMQLRQEDFTKNQKEVFSDLTKTIKTDYTAYIAEMKKLNDQFENLTSNIESNKENYEKILPVLEENYKKLEVISDKGKEIISDHQKSLWEHNNKLDKTLEQLTQKMNDDVKDLKADTEMNLNTELKKASEYVTTMMEHADMIFKEVSVNTKKQIEEIASLGEKQIQELTESSIINVASKVDELRKQIDKFDKESRNELGAVKNTLQQLITDFESKGGAGKRRLF
jgi:hypothetical protein